MGERRGRKHLDIATNSTVEISKKISKTFWINFFGYFIC